MDEGEPVAELVLDVDDRLECRCARPGLAERRRADEVDHGFAGVECFGEGHLVEWARLGFSGADRVHAAGIVDGRGVEGRERSTGSGHRDGPCVHDLERGACGRTALDHEVVHARVGDLGPERVVGPRVDVAALRRDRLADGLAVDVGDLGAELVRAVLDQLPVARRQADREPNRARLLDVLREPLDDDVGTRGGRRSVRRWRSLAAGGPG